jgi:ceramide glucosyltransferase
LRCAHVDANLPRVMTKALLPYLFILPSLAYSLVTLSAVRAFFSREPKVGKTDLPVSIIKPIKGLDVNSHLNLGSFCRQSYPEFQIVFALQSAQDPCLPIIRQLMAGYPKLDMELVINPCVHGSNGKVSNLINAFPFARHDIIVIADSDVRIAADGLARISAHFSDPEVGLVTSLYRGADVHSTATAIEALGFTVEMMPNVIVAERLEGLSFALGAFVAVRRKALEEIGGFSVLADYLADDYQLGNLIHRAGWKVVLSGDFVESVMGKETVAAILSRQLRWCRTMRVSRPLGYFASGVTHPFPAVAASFAVAGFGQTAFAAVLLLYLFRGAILTLFSSSFVKDGLLPRYLWLLPFRDALSTGTWLAAFTGNRVRWRGEYFIIKTDGKIVVGD